MLALRADVVGDVGAYSIYPWTAALEPVQVVSFLPGPYRVEHYRGRVQAVATAKAPTGPYRGVGRPVSTFVMERLVDMAAARLASIRRRSACAISCRRTGFPTRSAPASCGTSPASSKASKPRARRSDTRRCGAGRPKRARRGKWFGIGIACYAELTGIGSRISVAPGMPINTGTETATIRINSTGAITAAFGIASHGQGLETTLAQVIAEHLGCAPRGYPRPAGRQRRGAGRHRHLCEPQHRAGRRRRAACVGNAAREGAQRRLASARSRAGRPRGRGRAHHGRRGPTAR